MDFIRGGSQGWLGGSLHYEASLTMTEEERERRESGLPHSPRKVCQGCLGEWIGWEEDD